MTRDIKSMLEKCAPCQQLQPQNQREPLKSHKIPELPWLKIGADLFELKGHSYLIMVDYLSKYPKVLHLPNKTANTVIQKMKAIFAQHSIPKELKEQTSPAANPPSLHKEQDPESLEQSVDSHGETAEPREHTRQHSSSAEDHGHSSSTPTRSGRMVVLPVSPDSGSASKLPALATSPGVLLLYCCLSALIVWKIKRKTRPVVAKTEEETPAAMELTYSEVMTNDGPQGTDGLYSNVSSQQSHQRPPPGNQVVHPTAKPGTS
ncbi:hypothetical protein GJAV_G00192160 [Gymnothorax javanicus]|nr:hypothetical protein GJAV_G00192160 [Gymnothorax javanicus]